VPDLAPLADECNLGATGPLAKGSKPPICIKDRLLADAMNRLRHYAAAALADRLPDKLQPSCFIKAQKCAAKRQLEGFATMERLRQPLKSVLQTLQAKRRR
jgi:hypothetical protein